MPSCNLMRQVWVNLGAFPPEPVHPPTRSFSSTCTIYCESQWVAHTHIDARLTAPPTRRHTHKRTCSRSPRLTDGDRVDGVGVAVVVAVVTVLAPIAAGHHEDAPEALAACQHSMLQGGLRSRCVGGQPGGKTSTFLPAALSLPSTKRRQRAQRHWAQERETEGGAQGEDAAVS